MKENLNSISKYKFENDDKRCNNKNKIIMKYMNTVEQELKEQEDQYSEKNKMNSSLSNNECEQESFLDSEEDLILLDDNLKCLDEEEAEKNVLNNSLKENVCSIPQEVNFNNNLDNTSDDVSSSEGRNKDASQQKCNDLEHLNVEGKEEEYDIANYEEKDNEENYIPQVEQEEKNEIAITENQKETQDEKRELHLHDTYEKITFQNTMDFNTTKNDLFYMDVKNINEWKIKYRYLTSSFRKLDKEINKMINKDHINLLNRRSIKQHKDFLDNEYKEWLYTLQKTISEYKKNISSSVSDLNEKEYFILSKNIFDDFKEKSIEEIYLDIIKKKKQIIQEQLSIKKEEIKKNKTEKRQKNVLSEEMLQRINERNERLLQKKVQHNNNIIEENNNEKDKKTKQKYMHIQSKLLSNTGKK
ncbi:hypothetical protein PFUGPA_05748 [Plasmodium falciparum Palo Alto/Uganda]|uniref:Uncharacterized protein n=1 Tax=Plasmodium falciparum (isolate Palo Alto / Uganda) TaxID=57270 RepID=W4IQ83_PLAFP|nr:hypothetical protein PFUGPA_05748 [Plasmodium falciparum Palo Alto/Uganda]